MKKAIVLFLKVYKRFISTILFGLLGHGCRYNPTCAVYSKKAIQKHGITQGTLLSVLRILRCHPFSGHPAFDPVPERNVS